MATRKGLFNLCKIDSSRCLQNFKIDFSARGPPNNEEIWGIGNKNWVDMVFVQMHGIHKVDWQGKEMATCFEKARIGYDLNSDVIFGATNCEANFAECILNP